MTGLVPVLMFPALFAFAFAGLPIAFAMMLVAAFAGWLVFGDVVFSQLYGGVYTTASNFILASIPLFVFMGAVLERSGIAARLFHVMQMWLGGLPGGLAVATLAMGAVFAAASGVVGAVEVVIGLMAIPAMRQYRYRDDLTAGTICAGGSLGTMIPPSIVAVVYASLAQISIGELLAAMMLPGLIMVALFVFYVLVRCLIYPDHGPPVRSADQALPLGEKLAATAKAFVPAVVLIIAVLGSILAGAASPTEAAALGAAGAVILTAFHGELSRPMLRESLRITVRITAMIMLIVAAGTMFTGVFVASGGGRLVQSTLAALDLGTTGTLVMLLAIVFVLGFIMDWVSIVLICVPVFAPIIKALGVDPVWFAVLVVIMIQTSYLTPPMAPSIFYLKAIAPPGMTYGQMCLGVIPFIILQFATLGLVIVFPSLATWLPKLIVGF
jgi:tripartite ATP-independent transporter DctM subunit